MDGYEANKRIALSPLAGKPIVVALSANTDDDTRRLVDSFGFFFYLSKPMVSASSIRHDKYIFSEADDEFLVHRSSRSSPRLSSRSTRRSRAGPSSSRAHSPVLPSYFCNSPRTHQLCLSQHGLSLFRCLHAALSVPLYLRHTRLGFVL
jgi:CheY-like chemotaxis protein